MSGEESTYRSLPLTVPVTNTRPVVLAGRGQVESDKLVADGQGDPEPITDSSGTVSAWHTEGVVSCSNSALPRVSTTTNGRGGRRGQIAARSTNLVPCRWTVYVVDDDMLGFTRLASRFGFTIDLEPAESTTTTVSRSPHYRPRGLLG